MNFLRIITVLNWIVIAFVAYLVIAETLFPAKGGDAAGRGMGQAIYYLAIIALVILLGLNLLPYKWAKYTAFGLVAVPILYIQINPIWRDWRRNVAYEIEEAKPIFPDKERDQIARAVREGQPDKLKTLLQTPIPRLHEGGELLAYAIMEAGSTSYKPAEKLECVRLLFEAGAQLDSADTDDVPIHMAVASSGNASLLRLLLEQGADANAYQPNFKRPIIFEAINSYQTPEASVRALLEFGADPNATAVEDDEQGPISALWWAAQTGRWSSCTALLEKGANPDFKTADGTTFRSYVVEQEKDFHPGGYATQEDFDRFKRALAASEK